MTMFGKAGAYELTTTLALPLTFLMSFSTWS